MLVFSMDNLNIKTAAVITIGNEILSGKTIDTNSAFIAQRLAEIGIQVIRTISVGDDIHEIQWAIKSSMDIAQLIICTGGLGPTRDDITKRAIAEALNKKIIVDEEQLHIVEEKFRSLGYKKMPETNLSQAEIPEGAVIFTNKRGTAPGLLISDLKSSVIMLPGVPEEMRGIIDYQVIPYLKANLPERDIIRTRTIRTTGMGESRIAEILEPVLPIKNSIEIAYLPDILGVDIRLTARGKNENKLRSQISKTEQLILDNIPEIIYGFDNDSLEAVIGEILRNFGLTLSIAESCTGGLIGDRITAVSGSSNYFDRGIVTYSNESKVELLGVKQKTLDSKGAVSQDVAAEMAEGIRVRSGCDIGVSTTGIAGPTGGTPQKPVGLVYIGLSDKFETIVKKLQLKGNRTRIKRQSAQAVLNLIRIRLNDKNLYCN